MPNVISVRLENQAAQDWIFRNNVCVPTHKAMEIGASYKVQATSHPCDDRDYMCSIATHSHGWTVVADVTKELYANPDAVCALVDNFLRTYTVEQDDIR
jgi:hypothetical protein